MPAGRGHEVLEAPEVGVVEAIEVELAVPHHGQAIEGGLDQGGLGLGVGDADAGGPAVLVDGGPPDDGPDRVAVCQRAPLSGHFATLLRNTVEVLLRDHDVYVTDWANARDVPVEAGRFGVDDYVAYLIRFLEAIGPGATRPVVR